VARVRDELLAHEIRPGVVWIRPGQRPYTVTDIVVGACLLALLEVLVGYWIVTMTSSRVYGLAAMGLLLLVILLSVRIAMHRNIKMTRRKVFEANAILARAVEGDPTVDDAMLCSAIFAKRRAHAMDVSSIRVRDVERVEHRLSRRLPRVWLVTDDPVEIECGFVRSECDTRSGLRPRRAGMPKERKGEWVWPSSPVVPMGDQAGLSALLLWLAGLLTVMTMALIGASAGALLITIVVFILISMIWLARSSPVGYALAVASSHARIAKRTLGSRLGRGFELCPEDTLVVAREPGGSGMPWPVVEGVRPLVWRFVADSSPAGVPGAIEIQGFDPEGSPWWWVADQSWVEDGEEEIGLAGVEPEASDRG